MSVACAPAEKRSRGRREAPAEQPRGPGKLKSGPKCLPRIGAELIMNRGRTWHCIAVRGSHVPMPSAGMVAIYHH